MEAELRETRKDHKQEKAKLESQVRGAALKQKVMESEAKRLEASLLDKDADSGSLARQIEPLQEELRLLRGGLRGLGCRLEDLGAGNFDCGPGRAQDAAWERGGAHGPALSVLECAAENLTMLSEQAKSKASISRVSEERVMAEVKTRIDMEERMESSIKNAEKMEQVRSPGKAGGGGARARGSRGMWGEGAGSVERAPRPRAQACVMSKAAAGWQGRDDRTRGGMGRPRQRGEEGGTGGCSRAMRKGRGEQRSEKDRGMEEQRRGAGGVKATPKMCR